MSPLVVLGTTGTVMSTIVMLPHLGHALRERRPSGSALAWLVGGLSALIWLVYGIAAGDLLVAAPGLVTVPANLVLGLWSLHVARASRLAVVVTIPTPLDQTQADRAREIATLEALYAAKAAHPAGTRHRLTA